MVSITNVSWNHYNSPLFGLESSNSLDLSLSMPFTGLRRMNDN